MASNAQLYSLRNDQTLLERVAVSVSKAVATVAAESTGTANHAARLTWARQAMANPLKEAEQVIWILLAQNAGLSEAQIRAVADSALDSAVATLINPLANVSA